MTKKKKKEILYKKNVTNKLIDRDNGMSIRGGNVRGG